MTGLLSKKPAQAVAEISSAKSVAAAQQENENQKARRHAHQPKNDVTDLSFFFMELSHADLLSRISLVGDEPLANGVPSVRAWV